MLLLKNALLGWHDPGDPKNIVSVDRVLFISSAHNSVWTINIRANKGIPVLRRVSELQSAFDESSVSIVEDDPYAYLRGPEASFSEEKRNERDASFAVLEPYLEAYGEDLLDKERRGAIILEIMTDTNWKKKRIYKSLRRYWQSGQIKNAFLPDWHRRGGKNVPKQCSGKKRGRPRKVVQTNRSTIEGINVDKDIYHRLKQGIRECYLNTKLSFTDAFDEIVKKQFTDGVVFQNGIWVPQPWAPERLPTERQAWYVYEKDFMHTPEAKKLRHGERRFNLQHRALTGDTTSLALWPGSLYQIDATVGDIYLRSQLDPNRIIGRPVIYLVVDVFSRMIVGFAVLMEGPSWMGALQALECAFIDKTTFCANLGVDISPEAWPCSGIPEAITADNGEFLGYNATNLNSLDVLLHNTPPFRPDWKFLVECYFQTIQTRIKWVPGYLHPERERGDKDTRLDGVLTLRSFRQLLVWCIIDYNNHRFLDNYAMTKEMIQQDLNLYPSEIWRWGLDQVSSPLRWEDPKQIRAILLPRDKARVTRNGLKFKNLFYTCPTAERCHWFTRASGGEWDVDVSYDPRSPEILNLIREDDLDTEPCRLLSRAQAETFKDHDWYEIEDHLTIQSMKRSESKLSKVHRSVVPRAMQKAIVDAERANLDKVRLPQSKAAALKDIKKNKQHERNYERAVAVGIKPDTHTEIEEDYEYIGIDEPVELLRTAGSGRPA